MSRLKPHAGVGAPSIMLIIVVLSLTTFGVLTLVSAREDHALSARTLETTSAYYRADEAAQRKLMSIDEALTAGGALDAVEGLAPSESEPGVYTFLAETGDGRAIRVTVRAGAGKGRYTVTEYRLIHLTDWGKQSGEQLFIPAS